MKAALRLLTCFACAFGVALSAQSTQTFNLAVPTSCGVYSQGYSCDIQVVTPTGNNALHYAPRWGTQLGYLYFAPGDGVLGDLGYATVDSATTTLASWTDNGKKPNTTGYIRLSYYLETTTFHDQAGNPLTFTGSSSINYTATTQCCSSGRGASSHTVWTITSGTVSITQ